MTDALVHKLVADAAALKPDLGKRRAAVTEQRSVHVDTIRDFQQAGFFDVLKPAAFGGMQLSPKHFYDVVREIASACPSSGWVLSVVGVHNWQLALLPLQAQQDVWGSNNRTLISSSYNPTGSVTRDGDHFRISGRWFFSSGCDHCDWVFLGGFIPPKNEGDMPQLCSFLLPRSDYTIVDDWFVSGLKGTGSKSIVVDNALVPAHRVHSFFDGFAGTSPGVAVNRHPIYRLPFGQVFIRAVSTPAIGACAGALEAFNDMNRVRINSAGSKAAELPATITAGARAFYAIENAVEKLHQCFDEQLACIERQEPIPINRRAWFRYASSRAVQDCVVATQQLLANAGGKAVFADNTLNQFLQDLVAIGQHAMNELDKPERNYGRLLLGFDNTDYFI
jgi:3-hydroxy-9,10-secoandrosta-1,3,5(10)-triene-9,17-dione monooxygenase